jgi:phosphatidylglycerol:prolipoprotein diacylglycerol transferase
LDHMLPYFPQPVWTAGPITLSPFGALAVAAIVTGWILTRRAAARLGLEPEAAFRLARLLVLGGFVGAVATAASSRGALLGAAAAGLIFLKATGRSLRYFDPAALAFPPAWTLARTGCSLAHDHRGAPSTSFLAVRFPEGPRLDLGLLEMLAVIPLAVAFAVLARRERPAGFFSGLLAVSYGTIRLVLGGFPAGLPTNTGYALAAIAAGAVVLGISMRRRLACSGQ